MREMKPSEVLAYLGSLVGIITVAQSMLRTVLPPSLQDLLRRLFDRLKEHFTLYHYVDIPENDESSLANELYGAIKLHLSANAKSYSQKAKRVKLCRTSTSSELTWSPARREQVPMKFEGARVWWEHHVIVPRQAPEYSRSWQPRYEEEEERRKYTLRVHKRDKERIVAAYMEHILKQAQDIKHNNRQRHLYTNAKGGGYLALYRSTWDSVPFKHPSTFKTLAMDPAAKAQLQGDLQGFLWGKEFYQKTGRAWKRGYLLHGPPGTGKSSLIGAMANFLRFDVYDLELTQVRSNGDLRKMLLRTTSKSIIVIEDIDCSLDLANTRAKKASSASSSSSQKKESRSEEKDDSGSSAMTLSGLLNFTDGLWSCCGEERIFVFTTNHVENLDPALLRPGRMDMHILMSYCAFPGFKVLVNNYLDIDDHPLFSKAEEIIDDAHVTPAEVSEVFMRNREDPDKAMEEVLSALEVAKARPWPPIPVKGAGAKEAATEEAPGDVEEVKKAVDVVEEVKKAEDVAEEVKNPSVQKERCPFCPCRKKERSSKKRRNADTKGEKKGVKKGEDVICIDKDEVPQNIKKVEKAD